MKKIIFIVIPITICFIFTSCSTQLSDYMIIKGIGIDYTDDNYVLTVRYVDTSDETSEKNYTVIGETVYSALTNLSLTSGKIPLYSSADYLIFNEEVSENGLDEALDFFVRYFKAKSNISMYVCENSASDILEFEKDEKLISSDYLLESTQNKDNLGKTVNTTVLDYISYMENESHSCVVPYLFIEDDEIFATKSAVFSNYKLKLIFTQEETQSYLMSKSLLCGTSEVVALMGEEKVTLEIAETQSSFSGEFTDNGLKFDLCVKIELAIVSMPITLNSVDYTELEEILEEKLTLQIKEMLNIDNLLLADFFGIGNYLYRNFWNDWQNNGESWSQFANDDMINVEVQVSFIKTGEEDNPFYS
ncbi:MAG: Ger(x)C family spore germination protein [Clostridia bacterium]